MIKNKKGFTLIEIIVGLAICVIFITVALSVVFSINNVFSRTENNAESQLIAKNLIESIRGETNTCSTLDIQSGGKEIVYDGKVISVNSNGYLVNDGELEYPESYYNGKTIKMNANKTSTNKVDVLIEVLNEEGKTIAKTSGTLTPAVNTSE